MDDPLDAVREGRFEDRPSAVHIGRADVFGAVQGQRRGRVNHETNPFHRAVDIGACADVAVHHLDAAVQVLVGEVSNIEGYEAITATRQVPEQIDAEKTCAAGYEDRRHGRTLFA